MSDFYLTKSPAEMSAAALECGASEELVRQPSPPGAPKELAQQSAMQGVYEDYVICTRRIADYEGRVDRYVCTVRGKDGFFGIGFGQTIGAATDDALKDGGRADRG